MLTPTSFHRRHLLRTSAAVGIGAAVPRCLLQAASDAKKEDRVLVVVQLSGGNDGLNTIVPHGNDEYHRRRPTLAVSAKAVLPIDDHFGFHPQLSGFDKLYDAGNLTIIQGVGYAQPNRSHFESMDIWHTCQSKNPLRNNGWLGRYLDAQQAVSGSSHDVPALHLGGEQQPLALQALGVRVPSVKSLKEFQLKGPSGADASQTEFNQTVRGLADASRASSSDLLSFVQSSTSSALISSQRVEAAQRDYHTSVEYPDSELARKLRMVAQLIDAGLQTSIYYVTLDGFDTHSHQQDAHAALLRQWSSSVAAFVEDLQDHNHARRVLLMNFSEFGRRVEENASKGTDHGAAAPMILIGGKVKGGLVGTQPSLTDLDDGDLKYQIDFRQVYATVLDEWLGCESESILQSKYEKLSLFSAT